MHIDIPLMAFQQTTDKLIDVLSEIQEKDFNTKPDSRIWSAGQIGDHLLKSYGLIKTLRGSTWPVDRQPDMHVEMIRDIFLDFSIRMESPEAILPSEHFIDQAQLLSQINTCVEEFEDIILNENLEALCTDFIIPEYGAFTRLEWIWFTIFHTQRHVYQLSTRFRTST